MNLVAGSKLGPHEIAPPGGFRQGNRTEYGALAAD
jgi:hypothetical protein